MRVFYESPFGPIIREMERTPYDPEMDRYYVETPPSRAEYAAPAEQIDDSRAGVAPASPDDQQAESKGKQLLKRCLRAGAEYAVDRWLKSEDEPH